MTKNIKPLLNPNRIAVIGASRHQEKIGHIILKNILDNGFAGQVYPVNPKADQILGQKAFASVTAIKEKVDLAIIVVPAKIVPQVLEECGQAGVKAAVIISAGFAETGGAGQEAQQQLVEIASQHNISLLGPNCLGFINPNQNLDASWGRQMPPSGNIAFLSQSGAICAPVLEISQQRGLGFSYFVSLGNKAVLDENDFLTFLAEDEKTAVIIAYLESFQDGRRLINIAQEISPDKPIIILKAGASSAGAGVAQSHTASLATPARISRGALRQAGIIQANNLKELMNLTAIFSHNKTKQVGQGIAIVTNGGGPSVLATDAIAQNPFLKLAELEPATQQTLAKALPTAGGTANPIDLLGTATAATYHQALETTADDNSVGAIITMLTKQRGTKTKTIARAISQTAAQTPKPVINCFMGAESLREAKEVFSDNNLTNFVYPKEAVFALGQLYNWQNQITQPLAEKSSISCARVNQIINAAQEENQALLKENDGFSILNTLGITTPEYSLIEKETDLEEAWQTVVPSGYLKALSSQLAHKTEEGGVVKVTSQKDLVKRVGEMKKQFDYPLILAKAVTGTELIIGSKRDPSFGPTIMVGAGGIYTEILEDSTTRIAPINPKEAKAMLEELRIYPVLAGSRGEKSINWDKLTQTIAALSQLTYQIREITAVDINPLIVNAEEATAVDVKIHLQ